MFWIGYHWHASVYLRTPGFTLQPRNLISLTQRSNTIKINWLSGNLSFGHKRVRNALLPSLDDKSVKKQKSLWFFSEKNGEFWKHTEALKGLKTTEKKQFSKKYKNKQPNRDKIWFHLVLLYQFTEQAAKAIKASFAKNEK